MDAVISFLSDFGSSDTSVGQCKGVIAAISPKAVVIDISHDVPHFDVLSGAWMLESAVRYFPPCVHVAVVDPGVGTTRRPIAIESGRGDILIGPDNGLLTIAAESVGGIAGAVELSNQDFWLPHVSNTFHGRDIFCPAAAHVAHGVGMHMLGANIDLSTITRLADMPSKAESGRIETSVIGINEFGTLALAASAEMLSTFDTQSLLRVTIGKNSLLARRVRTFGDSEIGAAIILADSYGRVSISLNRQSLSEQLGLRRGDHPTVTIEQPSTEQQQ